MFKGKIKTRISMAKETLHKKKNLFSKTLMLKFEEESIKRYIWTIGTYGDENCAHRKVGQ
jgi:hypothetical protein